MATLATQKLHAQLNLAVILARETTIKPYVIAPLVLDFAKIAASLHKRYENECSYEWANTEKYTRATERMEEKALKWAKEHDITLELQRDPRGWPLIFKINGFEERLG